jgi:hypothetical protein
MTDFHLPIPGIIVGGIAAGLWAGHHQPKPVTCEPGTSPYAPMQTASPATFEPPMCPIKIIRSTPGYEP